MSNTKSNRLKEAEKQRVLDVAARHRRARKALEALEQDNFHEDPHADLVMSKKVPKFQDGNANKSKDRKSRRKGPEYFRAKYRKTFQQILEEEKVHRPSAPNYYSISAPAPTTPKRHFCAVCGNFSKYTCTACGTRFCAISCLDVHKDTRCLKWTA